MLAGFARGALDTVLSRVADVLLGFPYLVFAIGLMGMMGPGLSNIVLTLVLKEWVVAFRVARGETLGAREQDYVEAARAVGCPPLRILREEILPNILSPVLVVATIRIAHVIIMEASLSFLGLGVQPPRCRGARWWPMGVSFSPTAGGSRPCRVGHFDRGTWRSISPAKDCARRSIRGCIDDRRRHPEHSRSQRDDSDGERGDARGGWRRSGRSAWRVPGVVGEFGFRQDRYVFATLGLLAPPARVAASCLSWQGTDLRGLSQAALACAARPRHRADACRTR